MQSVFNISKARNFRIQLEQIMMEKVMKEEEQVVVDHAFVECGQLVIDRNIFELELNWN